MVNANRNKFSQDDEGQATVKIHDLSQSLLSSLLALSVLNPESHEPGPRELALDKLVLISENKAESYRGKLQMKNSFITSQLLERMEAVQISDINRNISRELRELN